ncbi:hypothetical protein BLNAU_20332 [Blattamonas nauphoetae]|uniref:Uncharacterized protein n=1 Tax=Blattamonas nauphoetae TaxID=2049346 RepID=A0ABQ9WYZ8_9EUKA|nr:hypothetical protein BLNAU_20332 [Blattamonas nauphoetae]
MFTRIRRDNIYSSSHLSSRTLQFICCSNNVSERNICWTDDNIPFTKNTTIVPNGNPVLLCPHRQARFLFTHSILSDILSSQQWSSQSTKQISSDVSTSILPNRPSY